MYLRAYNRQVCRLNRAVSTVRQAGLDSSTIEQDSASGSGAGERTSADRDQYDGSHSHEEGVQHRRPDTDTLGPAFPGRPTTVHLPPTRPTPTGSTSLDEQRSPEPLQSSRKRRPGSSIHAIAINEDSSDRAAFAELNKTRTRLCYASPECLLRNNTFKQLFRNQAFRDRLIAIILDEAHVAYD